MLRILSRRARRLVCAAAVALLAAPASAHFLWIHLDPGGLAVARLQFSEGVFDPTPPDFLRPLEGLRLRGPGALEATFDGAAELGVEASAGWLAAEHEWGLMGGGDARFLLVYHAKGARTVADAGAHAGLRAELFLHAGDGGGLVLSARFDGEPAVGSEVTLLAREGHAPLVLETDARGEVEVPPLRCGAFQARALVVEPVAGEHGGEPYAEVRHYATLLVAGAPSSALPEGADAFAHQWLTRVEGLQPRLPGWAEAVSGRIEVACGQGRFGGEYRFDAAGGVVLELPDAPLEVLDAVRTDLALEGWTAFRRADVHPFAAARAAGLVAPVPATAGRGTELATADGRTRLRVEGGELLGWTTRAGDERLTYDRIGSRDGAAGAVAERFAEDGAWRSTSVRHDRLRDLDGYPVLHERELLVRTPTGAQRLLLTLATAELVRAGDS